MRMTRVPRMEEPVHDGSPPPRERRVRKDNRQPHSETEEYIAYGVFVFILGALVIACVGLSRISWKKAAGGYDTFGVREVHMDSTTHLLETMGFVWPVYTASRCALGFTIIGVIFSVYALYKVYKFCSESRGSLSNVMQRSFFCSFWYLWAIMLYGCLFPKYPFKGDLYFYELGSNFTSWSNTPQQTVVMSEPHQIDFSALIRSAHGATDASIATQSSSSYFHPSLQSTLPTRLWKQSPSLSSSSSSTSAISSSSSSSPTSSRRFRTLADDAPTFPTTGSGGVPTYPSPSAGSGASGSTDTSNPEDVSEDALSTQYFYARMAWEHLQTDWQFGTGYWLVMSSAVITLFPPVAFCAFLLAEWLHEQHKAREVQQKWLLPIITLFFLAWVLAITALGSRFWKASTASADTDRFGLDQMIIDGRQLPVQTYRFAEKEGRIKDASAVALAFGIMGVLTGCATWVVMIFHIYDSAREWLLAFVLTAVTSGLWLIALISYGATFPHWILSTYYEFGYSFWLLLTSTCVYFIPVVAFIAWRLVLRAQATTEEERHMACPTLLTTASLIFTLASLCTTYWAQSTQGGEGYENHLGLLEGRYNGDWIHFRHLAQIDSHITSAGMSTFILLLCSLLIQTPIAWLGWRYVLGVHEVCKGQMPLLNTAMSAASFFMQLIAVVAYAVQIPFATMPDGYRLSHSWRVQIVSVIWTLASCIGFGYLAEPPLPGEPNILASAIRT